MTAWIVLLYAVAAVMLASANAWVSTRLFELVSFRDAFVVALVVHVAGLAVLLGVIWWIAG